MPGAQQQVYCVHCRATRGMKTCKQVTTKNGRTRLAGECATCGKKVSRITGKSK